jgi:hypothetical protein
MTDLILLTRRIAEEIDDYAAPSSPNLSLGSAPERAWISEQLHFMRSALVVPYRVQVTDDAGESRAVFVVANDELGSFVVYDPSEGDDFALAVGSVQNLVLAGPRGDAVGCFLAR